MINMMLLVRVPLFPVPVPVPVHDVVFANLVSALSSSLRILVYVYVNVYRFAVNVYGLPANV